ncbi:MAG: phosphopentomutase [Deltaproteobacteria bacterium]|nr:phosphopentomutase [Deltaproteobacteria bacterium]
MNAIEKGGFSKILWLVMDSVGAGEMPDADRYGDRGANTLGNTARAVSGLRMPNLGAMGLGNVTEIQGVPPVDHPNAHFGRMAEASPGKDTTTGHWEMAGVVLSDAFPVFHDGFPKKIIDEFSRESGFGVLGNEVASGTEIIERLGQEHQRTGRLIVYTSADSVFQVAAHEETVPLDRLYEACLVARRILDEYKVGRVIARPFVGEPGAYRRTYNRRDFSMAPPRDTVLDLLTKAGVPVVGVGKIHDIFAGRGLTRSIHTEGNTDGLVQSEKAFLEMDRGLVFTNLVDFDMLYGHRRNPQGYARALEETDAFLPRLIDAAGADGLVIITADHGCDPTADWSTDHTREFVPLIIHHAGIGSGRARDLGTRTTFADAGQTVAANFGVGPLSFGKAIAI